MSLSPSTRDVADWAASLRARATAGYVALGGVDEIGAAALAAADVGRIVLNGVLADEHHLFDIRGDAGGTVLASDMDDRGVSRFVVSDVDVAEIGGAARAVRDALVDEARVRNRQCSFSAAGSNRAIGEIARSGPHQLVATRMWLSLPAPTRPGPPVELTTMTDDEFSAFRDHLVEGYATDMARAGAVDPDVARESSRAQTDALLPDGAATAGHFLLTAHSLEPIGVLWLFVGDGPAGRRAFVYDVEVDEAHRGHGYGRAIMEGASSVAAREGAGYVGLNVFGFNDVARSLYTSMGYGVEGEFVTIPS